MDSVTIQFGEDKTCLSVTLPRRFWRIGLPNLYEHLQLKKQTYHFLNDLKLDDLRKRSLIQTLDFVFLPDKPANKKNQTDVIFWRCVVNWFDLLNINWKFSAFDALCDEIESNETLVKDEFIKKKMNSLKCVAL